MRYIYTLSDSDEVRYVGQTSDIERRFRGHLASSLNKNSNSYNTHKSRWIRKILNEGRKPIINIIETCESINESNYLEKFHIDKYTNLGIRLTNSHSGDVCEFSIETKNKMSSAKKGKKLDEIVGIEKSIELRKQYSERIKANNPNKSSDPVVKEKISETLKEYFSDKTNHWAYGLKMTDDHNEKLRMSKIGNPKNIGNKKPRTEEQKEKTRISMVGKKVIRYKIIQYSLNMEFVKEWNSLREINNINSSFNRKQIAEVCKGTKNSYAGFIWKYKIGK